jgi:hypothetical protein
MDIPAVENIVFGGKRQRPNGFGGQKPSGRRGFWLLASWSRASQPAAGMLRPLRPMIGTTRHWIRFIPTTLIRPTATFSRSRARRAESQNPQPQHHSQFSDRLSRFNLFNSFNESLSHWLDLVGFTWIALQLQWMNGFLDWWMVGLGWRENGSRGRSPHHY